MGRLLALLSLLTGLIAAAPAGAAEPIAISLPVAAGEQLSGVVELEAAAIGPVDRVEFLVDGVIRWVDEEAPFRYGKTGRWDTSAEADGEHTLALFARSKEGRIARAQVRVRTKNSLAVAISGLRDGGTVGGRFTFQVRSTGTVTPDWVEVLVDGRVRATRFQPPFRFTLDGEQPGRRRVSVYAASAGGRTSSDLVHVQVHGGGGENDIDEQAPAGLAALRAQISHYRAETWRWQGLMQRPRTPAALPSRKLESQAFSGWVRDLWRTRARSARDQAANPPRLKQWLCIHRYEGAWNAKTGNGYFGGLQMNMDFQRAYGPELLARKGTADRWTPLEQIWVAERAYRSRGFQPWPQTARFCGLL